MSVFVFPLGASTHFDFRWLSGKAHENSIYTAMNTIMHWH